MQEINPQLVKCIFLDVVEFTRNRCVEAQAEIVEVLNSIVIEAVQECGICNSDLIYLPTGDGMCISILDTSLAYDIHIVLALDIQKRVKERSESTVDEQRKFKLRIGLNENVDNVVTDINGRRNIAGAGINNAQRVMGLADGGQVMLSSSVHETLRYREKYMNKFKQFASRIKHNELIEIHQFIGDYDGVNSDVPSRFSLKKAKKNLSRLLGFYIAQSIEFHKEFKDLIEKGVFHDWPAQIMLYGLAKDSIESEQSTDIQPYKPNIIEKDFDSMYQRFDSLAFFEKSELAEIVTSAVADISHFFEGDFWRVGYVFVNKDGIDSLKQEHPDIFRQISHNDIAAILKEN